MIKLLSKTRGNGETGQRIEIPEVIASLRLPEPVARNLAGALADFRAALGENLRTCIVYGSAVRGNFSEGVSDLNLFIVLRVATPEAISAVAEILQGRNKINPLLFASRGLERSMRAFALKFLSIARNYRLLFGEDVLVGFGVEPELETFLVEQELRNFHARLSFAFIRGGSAKHYGAYLVRQGVRAIVCLSDLLRAAGIEVPVAHAERIQVITQTLGRDAGVLRQLTDLKASGREVESGAVAGVHGELHRLLDRAIEWMEERWPNTPRL